jgi:uncharacterized protein YeaC (DUF1315 family)
MDFQQLLNSITPDIYQKLQKAVEIGKWPDGRSISEKQRSLCMQAIIAYDQRNPETLHALQMKNQSQLNGIINVYFCIRSSGKNAG